MPSPRKIAVAGATGRVGRHAAGVLTDRGYDAVPMSRSLGVDVITGDGLAAALAGVEAVIDAATGPSPEQRAPWNSSPPRPATSSRPASRLGWGGSS